jgi:Alw26I/Eco31I/Esp3I family type II restriction m6 adenine DNA methyltransferase
MHLKILTPSESLERTYRLQSANREQIELFKTQFLKLVGHINEKESEENVKDHLMDFLKEVYYKDAHVVAPKGKTDFVIHLGKDATTQAGVLFEVKRPANKGEMITRQNLNTKAFHELLLYYFQERERSKNSDIRHCVITNVYEWFIFDAALIDRLFYRNAHLTKEYKAWSSGQKVSKNNELFYNEIVKPFLTDLATKTEAEEIPFTYFDLRDFQKVVADEDKVNDKRLLSLYKILSPTHLLKLPTATDSNRLNPKFYSELLHLIGLEEIKDGGKKVIRRKEAGKRDEGSLLENTVIELDTANKLSHLPDRAQYGATTDEQLFSVALELCITWINRILFLKLLESQLVKYHNGNRDYAFLNPVTLTDFDELYKLFFRVLAKKPQERQTSIKTKFGRVPYLNSSLFEITELEDATININGLDDSLTVPLFSKSVLKDNPAYKHTSELGTMTYLFAFLDAYDFASESREEIQEKNRTLINASVLGLIFEKINGYKDGSFYTPGFITEYMCRETIRKTVVQKFNDAKGWNCANFADLENKDLDRTEANILINEIRICDPAVGSGHFLVSALNELIAIKSDLRVLQDEGGKRLKGYTVSILNDELVVQDEDEEPFVYQLQAATSKPTAERQRIQKTLFQEKQTIIENCLFGVDINPNSVKICRLRLWIELLKNAYYTDESGFAELETLPNIDINIKQGNSLVSRFELNTDLGKVLSNSKYTIKQYRQFVHDYKNAIDKDQKRNLESLITKIKQNFRVEIAKYSNPDIVKLQKVSQEFYQKYQANQLFGVQLTKSQEQDRDRLNDNIEKLKNKIADIENSAIYQGSFEWRFEFPEVLDEKGKYIGFDAVIGNPPYDVLEKDRNTALEPHAKILEYIKTNDRYSPVIGGKLNLYRLFIKLSHEIAAKQSQFSFIIPLTFAGDSSLGKTRQFFLSSYSEICFECFPQKDNPAKRVFVDAKQSTLVILAKLNKDKFLQTHSIVNTYPANTFNDSKKEYSFSFSDLQRIDSENTPVPLIDYKEWNLLLKIHDNGSTFFDYRNEIRVNRGEINQTILREYINRNSKMANLLKGVEVGRYYIKTKLSQGFKEYFDEERYLRTHSPIFLTTVRRIATQRITGVDEKLRLVATVIEANSYFADSTNSIYVDPDSNFTTEYVLALLNSKLLQWRFKKTSTNNNVGTNEIYALPIKYSNKRSQIDSLVNNILTAKGADPTVDTSAFESAIDKLVYELYGLTEEEIAIVEGL